MRTRFFAWAAICLIASACGAHRPAAISASPPAAPAHAAAAALTQARTLASSGYPE